jgi:hypothetical protein
MSPSRNPLGLRVNVRPILKTLAPTVEDSASQRLFERTGIHR